MKALRNQAGQFIPIAAMVTFTTVVFLVAAVNVYKVAQAKLVVQNLADAAALNIASQMASSLNNIADINEEGNHIVAPTANTPQSLPGTVPTCNPSVINQDLPPLSCVENDSHSTGLNMFSSLQNAQAYAGLIQKLNQAQQLFAAARNNFIGAGTSSTAGIASNSSLQSILFADIPDLGKQGTVVKIWNTQVPPAQLTQMKSTAQASLNASTKQVRLDTSGMQPLQYKTHDITVGYWKQICVPILGCKPGAPQFRTLGDIQSNGQAGEGRQMVVSPSQMIGWMEPDTSVNNAPVIQVSPTKFRTGAGVMVMRNVAVPVVGNIQVSAVAQAYVVEGSGVSGTLVADPVQPGAQRPIFNPTYWVKLAGPS